MTRRIFRTGFQLGVILIFVLFLVFLVDSRFRVLPNAIHSHLPAHHPGLVVTDVTITTCSSLNPFSSCKLDENWHRIEKDLYLGKKTLSKAYLQVQRKREEDLKPHEEVVYDIRVGGRTPPSIDTPSKHETWESRPAGVWIKKAEQRYLSDSTKVVTGVDVLFGLDAADPRSNWQLYETPLVLDGEKGLLPARLTVRKGSSVRIDKPVPRIRKDGKFKIMQAADLHLATGYGDCRDPMPPGEKCVADLRTLAFVERLIEEEQPDLVVLTGDQVNGKTAPDAQTAIYKYSALFARYKIPYAGIFGNHDDEGNLDRAQSMAIMDGLPYSLSEAGPPDVEGVGNYIIEILGRSSSSHAALTLYLLDTHSYSPDKNKYDGYDWLKESQIMWFKQTAQGLKKKHKEYSHIHMDLAFIHIPLPEYRNPNSLPILGNMTENPTAPGFNSNFKDALVQENVLVVSCGHDHVNDYCVPGTNKDSKTPALWMCYGGGAGFGGYGGYNGYHRRIRFFDIDMNEARIVTYKRLEAGELVGQKVDEQIIVDGGRVVVDL